MAPDILAVFPMNPMRTTTRQRLLRRLAAGCVLLMLVVTTASAWLRLAQPRPACDDWPHCRIAAEGEQLVAPAAGPALQAAARGVHRVAATAVLVLLLALLVLAARQPSEPAVIAHALALLALALALAALGVVTPRSTSIAVLLGNLIGGLLMLALAWRLLRRLQGAATRRALPRVLAALTAACWLLQAASGAVSGAGQGAAVAPQAHLALALATLPLAAVTGWIVLRGGRRSEGLALIAAAALLALLGGGAALGGAAAPLVLLHNATAAAGIALATGLTISPGSNPAGMS